MANRPRAAPVARMLPQKLPPPPGELLVPSFVGVPDDCAMLICCFLTADELLVLRRVSREFAHTLHPTSPIWHELTWRVHRRSVMFPHRAFARTLRDPDPDLARCARERFLANPRWVPASGPLALRTVERSRRRYGNRKRPRSPGFAQKQLHDAGHLLKDDKLRDSPQPPDIA